MPKSVVSSCTAKVDERKNVVYSVRLESGQHVLKPFEEFEKLYNRVSYMLPSTQTVPPKKKLFQTEAKLQEKRKAWIWALCQTVISHHNQHNNEEVRQFFNLPDIEDDDHVDLGPKELKGSKPTDFDLLYTIGTGTFGKVLQVRHKESGKIYAMKVLSKENIRKKNEVKHVMAELSVLKSNINHPFLVSLHFSFQTKEKLYFVLDHVNGGELFSHLQREKRFDEARSRFYAADIASAIGYLHENNIIYRDLKPENLLLDRKGYIVLTDFGLCKENMKHKDTTNTFCGTPEYLAPEIILKKPYDRTVDWWCLGAVLYEMLYCWPPFYSRDHKEMFDRIVNQPLRIKDPVSSASTDIITSMLSKDRTKRLGAKNDFKDIKDHPFFMPIDWDQLLSRKLKAPFVPKTKDETDLQQISETFTKIQVNPASYAPATLGAKLPDEFDGFTFVQPPHIK